MKLYNVTVWGESDKNKIYKKHDYYAEGYNAFYDYIIGFDSELDMYKNLYEGINDEDGYEIKITCYGSTTH